MPPRQFNKENKPKFLEKIESGNVVLRNILKSPVPSTILRSPDGQDTAKSATDFASLNTQLMQQKYGLVENSTDEKKVEFTNTRGNSQNYNGSGDFSKAASYMDESPGGRDGPAASDHNQ